MIFSSNFQKKTKIYKDSKYKFRYKSDQIQLDLNESICNKVDTIVKVIKNGSQKRASKIGQIHQRGY